MGDVRPGTIDTVPDQTTVTKANVGGSNRLAVVSIGLAGLVFYLNSFRDAFVLDDHDWIIGNPHIRTLWPPWQALFGGNNVSRPLVALSLAINYHISGLNPWSYHAFNLVIHISAALALYGIVRRTLQTERLNDRFGKDAGSLALVIALIWLVHPLQTQAVTYVIQRCESMMGIFYLLCLYCAIRATHPPRRLWYLASIAACAAGMLTKPIMVTAPVAVFLYDVAFADGPLRQTVRKRWPLYLALASTWTLLAATIALAPVNKTAGFAFKTISQWDYFKSEPRVLVHYIRLSLWPASLCLDYYGWPIAKTLRDVAPCGLILAGATGATIVGLIRRRPWAFLPAWFVLILSMTSGVVPIADLVVEHRMYLPLASVVTGVVLGCYAFGTKLKSHLKSQTASSGIGRIGLVAATLAVVALGFATLRRNLDYSNELAMWSDVVSKRPDNPRAHTNLGMALVDVDKVAEATDEFREAVRLEPGYEPARSDLGMALYTKGQLAEARSQLLAAISLTPDDPNAHCSLGRVLSDMGQTGAGLEEIYRSIEIEPGFAEGHLRLGYVFEKMGRLDAASDQYRIAAQLRPDWSDKVAHRIPGLKTTN